MSDASEVSEPARAEDRADPNRAEFNKYVAEFVNGPQDGTVEHRFLVDGKPEERLTQLALVNRSEAILWYVAQDSRDVGGVLHVRYAFDADDSDTLAGSADPDAETREI
jgi:hypothetical protein